MSEGIHILEGGLTRKLSPIDKIRTNTSDGNGAIWVPSSKANTGVLHASENGIYIASEDGYEAYSEVIVRVTKDSFDGDTSFEDWDYETPDMDLDNWDPETIEDFENDPEAFDDVFNNEDEWKDINKPIDTKFKDDKISGIDPISGNPMEVGLDENGFLTEKYLPSAIKIVVPPIKTEYNAGDSIDYTGIKVFLLKANGEYFTSDDYPTGEVPFEELVFPVTIAEGDHKSGAKKATDGILTIPFIETNSFHIAEQPGKYVSDTYYFFKSGNTDISVRCFNYSGFLFTFYVGDEYFERRISGDYVYSKGSSDTSYLDKNGSRGRYLIIGDIASFWNEDAEPLPPIYDGNIPGDYSDIIRVLYEGEIIDDSSNNIPVQWMRSDGEVLEDSFTITTNANSSTSDSGSGHTTGGF